MADRPLTRSLIRPAFRILRGKRGAHFEETWPNLTIMRVDDGGDVLWSGGRVAQLTDVVEIVANLGSSLAIVGSGPSITTIDIERLSQPSILLNGALSLLPRLTHPVVLAVEDERFIWRHLTMLRDTLRTDTPCLFSPAVLRVLAGHAPDLLQRPIGLIDDLHKPFDALRCASPDVIKGSFDEKTPAEFSQRPRDGIIKSGTVAYSALQIAMAGPATQIKLAGIDLGNAGTPRFYETKKNKAWSGLEKGQGRILAHFALAQSVAQERNIQLTCLSPTSKLLEIGYPFEGPLV